MTANDKVPGTGSPVRWSTRLRMTGILVLVLGTGGAGMVYWLGTRSADLNDDPSMLGFNKPAERQMARLYGKMGTLIQDWSEDLKHPGTQATLIAGFSALIAAGCLYFARLPDDDKTG